MFMNLNRLESHDLLKFNETVIHISTKRKKEAKKEKQLLLLEFTL